MSVISNKKKDLISARTDATRIQILKDVYEYARKTSNPENCHRLFEKVNSLEITARNLMEQKYIMNPKINSSFLTKGISPMNESMFSSIEEVLDYVALMTRNYLYTNFSGKKYLPNEIGFNSLDLSNLCGFASKFAHRQFQNLGINSMLVCINPGFGEYEELIKGYGHHFVVIVFFENKKYLFDCTYKQFFETSTNLLEKLGIYGFDGCYPGIYMMLNESRKSTAKTLLEKGWIELNDTNSKNYFDGYALSFRNGLFYDNSGKIDYTTSYLSGDYMGFLIGSDSQINREGKENLGIQEKKLSRQLTFVTPKF